ncbi:MAG: hypothetical protein R3C56_15890 [Pirellulaceae bacterium]
MLKQATNKLPNGPMDEMSLERPDNPNDSWEPCPPGMLTQMAQHAGRRHMLHRSLTIAGAAVGGTACVFLLLGSLGWLGLSSVSPSGASPLELNRGVSSGRLSYSCRDAIEVRDRVLLAGKRRPEVQTAVREHLPHCPHCRRLSATSSRAEGRIHGAGSTSFADSNFSFLVTVARR